MDRRLESARVEMPLWDTYDFCLISGTKDEDFSKVEGIWKSEKLRVARLK
jgi:guanylate kinase